jgi:hypothetical protein
LEVAVVFGKAAHMRELVWPVAGQDTGRHVGDSASP